MKKVLWLIILLVLTGCVSTGLSQRDREEFERWRERRERDKQEHRPKMPERKSSIDLLELSSNPFVSNTDEWKGQRKKEKPKQEYYKPYPRRWYKWHRNDRCRPRSC